MKKYLMIGFAAIAFASCSNHDFETMTQEQIVKAEYDAKFVAHFGNPASNQDWGLSKFNAYTKAVAAPAFTRTIASGWDGWVDAPNSEDYATDFPKVIIDGEEVEDVVPAGDYWMYKDEVRKNYKLDSNKKQTINFWLGNANIYVDGIREIEFKNPQQDTNGITFYILPGADVTFTEDFSYSNPNNPAMYVSEGAKVTFAGAMSANVNIYNRGTIIVNGVTGPYHQGVIFNENVFESKDDLAVFNDDAQVVNVGTWTVTKDLKVYGSGHFRNLGGTMTVSGTTVVNSNECSWINDATYTTDYFTYTAGSHDIINNCKLFVNEDFSINNADGNCLFQVDGGGSVLTKNFYGGGKTTGPFRVELGSKAIFRVTNDCYLDATAAGVAENGYGFHGVGDDYAVLDAKYVKNQGNPGHGYTVYSGKLYVSAESHFAQGTAGAADGASYIIFQNGCSEKNIYAPGFEDGKPAITIPAEGCSIGFEGDEEEKIVYTGRVMAEDLTASVDVTGTKSDWDFNDVVFDWAIKDKKAYIKLLAAGGTLQLRIGGTRDDATSEPDGSIEIHSAAGLGAYMCNTGEKTVPAKEIVLDDHEYNSVDDILLTVLKGGSWVEITAITGDPAAKFYCDTKTKWCDEYVDIKIAYPKFAEWVRTPSVKWEEEVESKLVDLNLKNNAEVLPE